MNFKLDENLGPTVQEIFIRRGHDCRTVREQNLSGAVDALVLEAAVSEGRILVTTDHDFGNILIYPPMTRSLSRSAGTNWAAGPVLPGHFIAATKRSSASKDLRTRPT